MRATMAKGPAMSLGGVSSGGSGGGSVGALTAVPTWLRFEILHTDLHAAALSTDIELYELPARGIVSGAFIKHSQVFSGTGIETYQVSLGLVGMLEYYVPVFDVTSAVAGGNFAQSAIPSDMQSYSEVTSIRLSAIASFADLSASVAGALDVWLLLSRLPG